MFRYIVLIIIIAIVKLTNYQKKKTLNTDSFQGSRD